MKHLKTYENIENQSNYLSIKKGDTVVYIDNNIMNKLKNGKKYIVIGIYDSNLREIQHAVASHNLLSVKDMDGNIIYNQKGKPKRYFIHRFMPELEYYANKYNI